jgi:predicted CXXCH cytochrome family protein
VFWLGACGLVAIAIFAARSTARDLATPRDRSTSAYVGSEACRSCHPDHHASWHRTFHRTMTQPASEQAVLGDFERGLLEYGGVKGEMRREGERFVMTFSEPGGATRRAVVDRTVGSHRYQQYLARDGDIWFRLPVAWNVAEERFIHMNGAFLTPDPELDAERGAIARSDYDRHVTRWNDNCIFCHNTAPNPGLSSAGHFESTTAELGIACEACHGPGEAHAAINKNPLRRYALHLSELADPTVGNPARMPQPRSSEVCGRCHGQRKAADINQVLREGDRFVPGTELRAHSTPLARDTTLNGEPGVFAARFWGDGTPRLTAYEYQGLLLSPCAERGTMTCASCHAMHDSEPSMQLRRDLAADAQCTQCHTDLRDDSAVARHTRHIPASTGSSCTSCHMPDVVYGLVAGRISHRIENPDPAQNERDARPDACTLCHVDRSRAWAIDALAKWRTGAAAADAESNALPEVARMLLAGDPLERSIAASALGREDAAQAVRAERFALLLDALARDRYPAVRDIARRSLSELASDNARALALLDRFDSTELKPELREARATAIRAVLTPVPATSLSPDQLAELRSRARDRDIEIGE